MIKHYGIYFLVCEDSDCGYSRKAKSDEYRCTCPDCGCECDPISDQEYNVMLHGGLDYDC